VVKDYASAIDTAKKTVTLAGGATIAYDKLVVSPGVELMFGSIEGLKEANASGQVLQAWKAGAETVALRRQLEAMPDGGVYAITIPEAPYRCPPGPYERASVIAGYFKAAKPRSKVLILDANPDVTSKGPLFKKVWAEQYKGIVEYRGQHKATAVDAKAGIIKFDVQDDVKANVLNVLPAMRAGTIAVQAGLNNQANNRWCGVNYLTFRIHRREGRARARRLHPGGAGHAQERPHGQQPRQGGRRRHRGAALGLGRQPGAHADQHLLQLCRQQERDPRGQRA
jgi:sulfide dehydrogenase [flavocytochrome c] flavoprotein subunit